MGAESHKAGTVEYYQPEKGRALNTFNKILTISLEIIEHEGVESLNTNRIAAECGINISTLYHYFPNKDSILHALYTRWFDRLSIVADKHLGTPQAPSTLKSAYTSYVLDLLNIDGFSPRAAVELERAIKTRKNLLPVDNRIVEQSITACAEDILAQQPDANPSQLTVPSAFMLVSFWGAISIAADMEESDYGAIAEHCAEMIVALVRGSAR
ncbi:TetR/AcrR family transcriptional regulator [Isoalcanivorax indicus]|uniref:TetR/AcrR family transcriptional regulator n=1 Tax=Isoalcanivorax indicus TaxID=2202653 RepID=UPI0013C48ECC|nr:TetR/AcrR family transcriptional regulator [Isoalcanivorax indicus]